MIKKYLKKQRLIQNYTLKCLRELRDYVLDFPKFPLCWRKALLSTGTTLNETTVERPRRYDEASVKLGFGDQYLLAQQTYV